MKVLIVADEESKYLWDHYAPGRLEGIDMILSCGDLKQEYLEFLVTMLNVPCLYVRGNHDKGYAAFPPEGCECVDDRIVDVQGLRILGLGGCIRYNQGPFQYTEKEMMRRIRKLRWKLWRAGGVDIILTHAPPHGYGDAPDRAHLGFSCFLPLIEKYRPMYLFHGHVHPNYGYGLPKSQQYADTIIMNTVGWQILDIEPRKREKLPIIGRFRHNKQV